MQTNKQVTLWCQCTNDTNNDLKNSNKNNKTNNLSFFSISRAPFILYSRSKYTVGVFGGWIEIFGLKCIAARSHKLFNSRLPVCVGWERSEAPGRVKVFERSAVPEWQRLWAVFIHTLEITATTETCVYFIFRGPSHVLIATPETDKHKERPIEPGTRRGILPGSINEVNLGGLFGYVAV